MEATLFPRNFLGPAPLFFLFFYSIENPTMFKSRVSGVCQTSPWDNPASSVRPAVHAPAIVRFRLEKYGIDDAYDAYDAYNAVYHTYTCG